MFKQIGAAMGHIKLPPLREVLSEDGIGSYSRYLGFWTAIFIFGWISYVVVHNHALPVDMTGPGTFLVAGQSAYAANQAKKVASALKPNTPSPVTINPTGTANVTPASAPPITPGDSPA
jgi:hypothetical protein